MHRRWRTVVTTVCLIIMAIVHFFLPSSWAGITFFVLSMAIIFLTMERCDNIRYWWRQDSFNYSRWFHLGEEAYTELWHSHETLKREYVTLLETRYVELPALAANDDAEPPDPQPLVSATI